jgi:hypothetical protein
VTAADIVFVVQVPLSQRDRDRYGFAFFQSQGLRVGVVDAADMVTARLRPHRRDHYTAWTDLAMVVLTDGGVGRREARELMAGARVVVVHVGSGYPQPDNLSTLRLIAASGAPTLLTASNAHPAAVAAPVARRRTPLERLRHVGVANAVLARAPLRLLGLRAVDYLVAGGLKCNMSMPMVGPETRIIQAHAQDYDTFLTATAIGAQPTDSAVYIDTYMGYHYDSVHDGHGLPVEPAEFYARLRRLFERIEAELGLEVVIAAHPRADYSDKPGLYGDRRIIPGRTVELVRDCRLALGVHSTAASFAVLFGKPLMVLATSGMVRHPSLVGVCENLAAALGRGIDWLDDPEAVDVARATRVDAHAYARYVADYIKRPGSPAQPYWQLVLDGIVAREGNRP